MKNAFLFLTLFLSGMFFSCGKDNGENLTGTYKMIERKWTLVQYTVNGADSIGRLDPRILDPNIISFYQEGSLGWKVRYYFKDSNTPNLFFSWSFNYDNTLQFGDPFAQYNPFSPAPFIVPSKWEILELTNDVFKLRMETDKEYIMVLK